MGTYLTDFIYLILEAIDLLMVYLVLFHLKLRKPLQILEILAMAVIFSALLSIFPGTGIARDLFPVIMLLASTAVSDRGHFKDFLKYFPFAFLISSDINILGSLIIAEGLHVGQAALAENPILTNLSELTAAVIFIIIFIADRKKSIKLRFYSKWQYIILLSGLIIIFLIVGLIQYVMQRGSSYGRELNIMMAAFLFFTACFFLLFILMQLASQRALKYRLESEREKYALEKQKAYIDHLNEENMNRRKIQHDINAHITAINGLIKKKDFDGLTEYMKRFEHGGRKLARIYCGLPALDAILSDFDEKLTSSGIAFSHYGGILPEKDVDSYEAGIIIYNLLNNAYEAVSKLSTGCTEGLFVKIGMELIHNRLMITVENSCDKGLSLDSIPETTKHDKEAHGYGLKNVKDIVDSHLGVMNVRAKDGVFRVTATY